MWALLGLVNGKTLLVAIIVGAVAFGATVKRSKEERDQ